MKRLMKLEFSVLMFSLVAFAQVANAEKYITPEEKFMKSVVLVRPGIDDLGGVSVSVFVEIVKKSKMDNGKTTQVKGWLKTPDGYALDVVGLKPYRLEFLWTGGDSSLLKPITMGFDSIPAMLYVMMLGG